MPKEQRDKIRLRVENTEYDVVGGTFQELLAAVKALSGRRYLGEQKVWVVSGSLTLVRGQLENSGFILEEGTPLTEIESQAAVSNDQVKIWMKEHVLDGCQTTATLTGASFREMLSVIKAIPSRRFDSERKSWAVPGTFTDLKAYFESHNLHLSSPKPEDGPDQAADFSDFSTDFGNQGGQIEDDSWTFSPETGPPPPEMPLDLEPPPYFQEEDALYDDDIPYPDAYPPFEPSSIESIEPPPPADQPPTPIPQQPPAAPPSSGRQDKIRVIVGEYRLVVTGGSFRDMLTIIKAIPGRRFDGQSKAWILPNDINSVQQHVKAGGFRLSEE